MSPSPSPHTEVPPAERWADPVRWLWPALVTSVIGGGGSVAGFLLAPRAALFSWLLAFVFFVGLSVAALLWLSTFHVTTATWAVLLRRPLEVMAFSVWLAPIAFIPIAVGIRTLYPWAGSGEGIPAKDWDKLLHKAAYLNVPFFLGRAVLYFALWATVASLLDRWSRRQDVSGEVEVTVWMRKLSAGALPLLGVSLSFATLDWLMSLEPLFVSTLYALYFFAGSFLAVLGILCVVAGLTHGRPPFAGVLRTPHLHSLGKLLLAFTVFWAYLAYDQFMLVWIAHLPEEVRWYVPRTSGGWGGLAVFLIVGRFALPFFLLLSRKVKERPAWMIGLGAWTLLAHLVDVGWLVWPALSPSKGAVHWTQPFAFLAMGGAWVALCVHRAGLAPAIPVRDPLLPRALRYHPK